MALLLIHYSCGYTLSKLPTYPCALKVEDLEFTGNNFYWKGCICLTKAIYVYINVIFADFACGTDCVDMNSIGAFPTFTISILSVDVFPMFNLSDSGPFKNSIDTKK